MQWTLLPRWRRAVWLVSAAAGLVAMGCADSPKETPVRPLVVRDVSPLLRGTIGAEVSIRGIEPTVVSGIGLVVGLNGTGGDVLPENVAATMEREMGLKGIGRATSPAGTALEGKTPHDVLMDKNVAVVIVQAAIPPGAPAYSTFDVFVRALNASSLEGGTLWSTDLRIGDPTAFGGVQARQLATARGPIFINPFAQRGKETEGVTATLGRILDGGQMTSPLPIVMMMDNPSHARVRAIAAAINSRFPIGPGDPMAVALGRSDSQIDVRVPRRYRDTPDEFLELVKHLQIDNSFPEETARRLVEGVKAEPAMASDVSWCLEAIGQKCLPFARELYEYPELEPRMAGLKAGARLNDALAAAPLREVAQKASGGVRTRSIAFLGELDGGPTVDLTLRELAGDSSLTVRTAAYEALAKRAVRDQVARYKAWIESNPDRQKISPTRLEELAKQALPGRNIQGIRRIPAEDKFFIDVVPYGEPLIYVTQQGAPRVVLFGQDQELRRTALVSMWDDRFMLDAHDSPDGKPSVRVMYRAPGQESAAAMAAPTTLPEFLLFLARRPTPEDPRPGLNMSYSDVVGVLNAMCSGGATRAAFATEQDRLQGQILAASGSRSQVDRPETADEEPVVVSRTPTVFPAEKPPEGPKIVPITPAKPQ